ncbi:hypothetical protein [Bradyrhizobium sp. CIR48]|uniref:hypothetical protein n=2 Tax=unclassified Bradyrhizobium TaxID=2631580 RepID=UPI00035FC88E|nr:hypothetical protein [Bradyrhizobium sp. CIR48]
MPALAFQHGQKSRLSCVDVPSMFFASQPGHREKVAPDLSDATRSDPMMDILMLALGFVFFALAIGYTYACERL